MSKKATGNILLLITALIWGTAFVSQRAAMNDLQPFSYNAARTLLGAFVLIPVILIFNKMKPKDRRPSKEEQKRINKNSYIGGIFCGIMLCCASSFQQCGINYTTAGKAGFITALYLVIVPIMGIFVKKKIPKIIWFCVALAVAGFYLLCVKEGFSVSVGDLLVLCCAFFFSLHIMVIDHFSEVGVDGVKMSCVQFFTAGIIMLVIALIFETPTLSALWAARVPILYAGIMSSGVAYTLQILGQQRTDPTTATLLMSLESVFAALSSWIILGENLSVKELFGCALVFIAVILAQIPLPQLKKRRQSEKSA